MERSSAGKVISWGSAVLAAILLVIARMSGNFIVSVAVLAGCVLVVIGGAALHSTKTTYGETSLCVKGLFSRTEYPFTSLRKIECVFATARKVAWYATVAGETTPIPLNLSPDPQDAAARSVLERIGAANPSIQWVIPEGVVAGASDIRGESAAPEVQAEDLPAGDRVHITTTGKKAFQVVFAVLSALLCGAGGVFCGKLMRDAGPGGDDFGTFVMGAVACAVLMVACIVWTVSVLVADVSYDANRLYIRGLVKKREFAFSDITSVQRVWISSGKSGSWRWSVFVRAADGSGAISQVNVGLPQGVYSNDIKPATHALLRAIERRNPACTFDVRNR